MAALSLRVSEEFKTDMESLSKATGRSISTIIQEWCTRELELEKWQIQRVETGIRAADDQSFVDNEQIRQALYICRN